MTCKHCLAYAFAPAPDCYRCGTAYAEPAKPDHDAKTECNKWPKYVDKPHR